MHYVNRETLINQHRIQQEDKVSRIDEVDKEKYEENLEYNIEMLLGRMK